MQLPDNHYALQMTRQQLSVATGLPGETIAYWLKERLIFALDDQKHGRGNHRRFGYEAVHIAAILAELSRYGMNTTGLRNLSSRLWRAVELGHLHPDFTPFDFMCCKNLLIGKEIAARGETVPDIMSIDLALARDDDDVENDVYPSGTPGPRHVKMMEWFSIDSARLLTAYADLMSRDIFMHDVPKWFVSANSNGSVEFILEYDPSGEDVEGRASYICLDIKKIVNRAWSSLTDQ
ncbi:MAG: hypothetical protein EOO77_05890 [Oxalobacteraceae bacterium]|nr:MAG: hypothetical protein EOO77_05890 [Oxalobacteraceae bacterium]